MIGIFGRGNISKNYVEVFESLGINYKIIVRNNQNKLDWISNFKKNIILENQLDYTSFKKWIIATNPESHKIVIDKIRSRSKLEPIICEKPFSYLDKDYDSYINDNNLYIAMNRRFYPWVDSIKDLHVNKEISNVYFYIPETVKRFKNINESILGNSIHLIDLFFFLFGKPSNEIKMINHYNQFLFCHITENNTSAILEIAKNVEDNCYIRLVLKNNRNLYIKPIEILKEIVSFKKIPPNKEKSYAQYQPIFKNLISLNGIFKPGFELMLKSILNDDYSRLPKINEAFWTNRFIKENAL